MAISVTTPAPEKFGWILNATSADASGCEELKAAPAAGTSIIIDHLTINSDAGISITIGQNESGGAVLTVLIGPVSFAANQSMQWDFCNGGVNRTGTVVQQPEITAGIAGGAISDPDVGRLKVNRPERCHPDQGKDRDQTHQPKLLHTFLLC